ncbi:folate family ECF transporter S component [Haloplasma contractile]|uniref:Membrane protein n=1 Tax=Haloplasma contractile SSD-17B TaxID=1033810 RepID=U2FHZ7_9MOLU|nr:folate family ECF transporter S component [Haloplasma contractile]ERJ12440.1 Putative membrane protein [Haloplasma contractile SSD-17B]
MGRNHDYTFKLVLAAIMGSIAVILKFVSLETALFRVTFFDIPVIFTGIFLGPFFGGAVGFIADIGLMLFKGYPPSLMTLSSVLWGVIPGMMFYFKKKDKKPNIILFIFTIIITSVICFSINTYQLYLWFGEGSYAQLPIRLIVMIIKIPLQISIIYTLFYVTRVIHTNIYSN